ncbi:hypothetical protein [Pseudomonas sp. C2B4]|uniref:hypothetical protein n=1 Tax=Pseudomonas sp. C2B4 TaxID=2735270 RepID=UPI003558E77D
MQDPTLSESIRRHARRLLRHYPHTAGRAARRAKGRPADRTFTELQYRLTALVIHLREDSTSTSAIAPSVVVQSYEQ